MKVTGIYYDVYTDENGDVTHISEEFHNDFVFTSGQAINFLIKNFLFTGIRQITPTAQFTVDARPVCANETILGQIYHAFGEGDPAWDISPVAVDPIGDPFLVDEFHRRIPNNISFIRFGKGTALSGNTSEIVDPRREESGSIVGRIEEDNWFNGQNITITSGTNSGETRAIISYTQSTGSIIVDSPFPLPIDSTSQYQIEPLYTTEPSNWMEIRTTIPLGTPTDEFNNKNYREQGLYLGPDADQPNGGIPLTNSRQLVQFKDNSVQLNRFYKIGWKF